MLLLSSYSVKLEQCDPTTTVTLVVLIYCRELKLQVYILLLVYFERNSYQEVDLRHLLSFCRTMPETTHLERKYNARAFINAYIFMNKHEHSLNFEPLLLLKYTENTKH